MVTQEEGNSWCCMFKIIDVSAWQIMIDKTRKSHGYITTAVNIFDTNSVPWSKGYYVVY